MSNTHIVDSLSTLFSMSTTAVLGAQGQFIAFMNPAAQELFRGDRTNHKLSELLPDHITEATATEFVTSAAVGKASKFRSRERTPRDLLPRRRRMQTRCVRVRSLRRFLRLCRACTRSRRTSPTTGCI